MALLKMRAAPGPRVGAMKRPPWGAGRALPGAARRAWHARREAQQ
jgi:hypothetical protein